MHFTAGPITDYRSVYPGKVEKARLEAFHRGLLNRGVLSASYGLFALSTPMTRVDAGKILAAIDGQSLDNCAVVVTRWFGGVLLGTGGLIRAYGGTAAACLRLGETSPVIAYVSATLSCPFSDLALVKSRLSATPNLPA